MTKKKPRKVLAAEARAVKNREFKVLQRDMGILSNEEEDEKVDTELPPNNPHKLTSRIRLQSLLSSMWGGAPGKRAARMALDVSFSIPIPIHPLKQTPGCAHLAIQTSQGAGDRKLPATLSPAHSSPHIESPPCTRNRSGNSDRCLETGSLLPFWM
jgi:hypothetical protein